MALESSHCSSQAPIQVRTEVLLTLAERKDAEEGDASSPGLKPALMASISRRLGSLYIRRVTAEVRM